MHGGMVVGGEVQQVVSRILFPGSRGQHAPSFTITELHLEYWGWLDMRGEARLSSTGKWVATHSGGRAPHFFKPRFNILDVLAAAKAEFLSFGTNS
ncbi:hypothetical protein Bca101_028018 [Brassica carinata]